MPNTNNYKVYVETKRVTDHAIDKLVSEAPVSPNCGLSCYLGEAFIAAEITPPQEDIYTGELIDKLIAEGHICPHTNNKMLWGWEKVSTIRDIHFPFDWDDTSKAIDFINIAAVHNKASKFDLSRLPNEDEIEKLFISSIFKLQYVGDNKDIRTKCKYDDALFVFFGEGSENMEKRDDPMVTVATLRMLASWYPLVIRRNKGLTENLLKRLSYTLNETLKHNYKFDYISRYYFSFGHFVYRFIELLDILKIKFEKSRIDTRLLKSRIKQGYDRISIANRNNTYADNEDLWWYLIGLKLDEIVFEPSFYKLHEKANDDILFQHKRLSHQYYAESWIKTLIGYELKIIEKKLKERNALSLNDRLTHKRSSIPIFALCSFLIFIISIIFEKVRLTLYVENTTDIIQIAPYQVREWIIITLLIVFGLRLYLHAWAVEETFLISRILPNINKKYRTTFSVFDIITRFSWSMLIMFLPLIPIIRYYISDDITWERYLTLIMLLILVWDIVTYYSGIKPMFKKDKRNIRKARKKWLVFDLIIFFSFLTLCIVLQFMTLQTELGVFLKITAIYFIVIAILVFCSIQIWTFGVELLRNKLKFIYLT